MCRRTVRSCAGGDFGGGCAVWHDDPLNPALRGPLSASCRVHSGRAGHRTPRGAGQPPLSDQESHTRGCQDQADAHGQDPCAVLPHRRRRLAHQARRPGDRGDRQVPPHPGALAHRGRLRARAVLARRRRAADRAGRRDPEDHRRLAEVQGPAGRRGHPADRRAAGRQEGRLRGRRQGLGRRWPRRAPPRRRSGRPRRPPPRRRPPRPTGRRRRGRCSRRGRCRAGCCRRTRRGDRHRGAEDRGAGRRGRYRGEPGRRGRSAADES